MDFSGEEGLGRYLDLHPFYLRFINSKFGRQTDYAEYVGSVTSFAEVPRSQRLGRAYRYSTFCAACFFLQGWMLRSCLGNKLR